MIRPIHLPALVRAMLTLLLAVMLTVQGLGAAGLMPGRTIDGELSVSVCSGAGLMPATIRIDTGQRHDKRDNPPGDADNCPFAVATHAALLPDAPGPRPDAAALAVPAAQFFTLLALGTIFPLPPATGPPAAA